MKDASGCGRASGGNRSHSSHRPQPKGRGGCCLRALLLAAVLAAYLADLVTHLSSMAAMRDLVVYRTAG